MSELPNVNAGGGLREGRQLPTPYLSQVRRTVDDRGVPPKNVDCSRAFLGGIVVGMLIACWGYVTLVLLPQSGWLSWL